LGDRPKVLAPVGERPFLAYLLDQLTASGVRKVVLCTGYLGGQVQVAFGNRYGNLELHYSIEEEPLGTAGALRLALPLLNGDPVLVFNGDSYCDVDLEVFFAWHHEKQAMGSLVLFDIPDVSRFGSVIFAPDGQILHFGEKGKKGSGWINAGTYLLSQCLLSTIPKGRPTSLEYEIFPVWAGKGLFGYPGGRRFLDIGTPASYKEAEAFFTGSRH
jgi:NDP-sugar pyrophosphorylase family protein